MQSADLLAVSSAAATPAAQPAGGADDADAFARALADEMDAAKAAPAAAESDGRCGTSGDAATADGHGAATPERPNRAARALLHGWRSGLLAADGVHGGALGRLTDLTGAIAPDAGAGPKPDPAKAGSIKGQGAFRDALDALRAAIQEALKDPSASVPAQGQLPPAVQAAIDGVLAAAPPGMAERAAAFAGKLTERLAAMLSRQGGESGPAEPGAVVASDGDGSGDGVLASVLGALDDLDTSAMPNLPVAPTADTTKTATTSTVAAPAAAQASPSGDASAPAAEAAKSVAREVPGAELPVGEAPDLAAADGSQTLAAQAPAAAEVRTAAAVATVRGSPETVAMLAATIARKLEGRTTHFDMELHPAEFGRVDVRLRIDAEGRVAAQMAFDNPVAAADLRARADELRRQLEQAGFQVASEDLTFTDKGAGGFDQNARNAFAGMDEEAGRGARARAFADGERAARIADDASRLHRRNLTGLDVRV